MAPFMEAFIKIYAGSNYFILMRYAEFQSDYVVYHDDAGDYSTNEPTMDGTASLIYLMAAKEQEARKNSRIKTNSVISHGAIIRGDATSKKIALVFTGDEFADGGNDIATILATTYPWIFLSYRKFLPESKIQNADRKFKGEW